MLTFIYDSPKNVSWTFFRIVISQDAFEREHRTLRGVSFHVRGCASLPIRRAHIFAFTDLTALFQNAFDFKPDGFRPASLIRREFVVLAMRFFVSAEEIVLHIFAL